MAGIDPISNVADAAAKIISLFKSDPNVKLADEFTMRQQELQGQIEIVLAQLKVDAVEAANRSWFVAGARPAVLWICATGLAVQFVVNPIATWVAALLRHPIVFPSLDMGSLMTLLLGLLGLGTMRTVEKLNNAQGNH